MKLTRKWLMVIALVMSLTMATAGTLAYLSDTDSKTNTFSVGNVEIELTEPAWEQEDERKLLPGVSINKDPRIYNKGNSDAWVWMEIVMPEALADVVVLDYNTSYWDKSDAPDDANGNKVVLMKRTTKLDSGVTTDPAFYTVSVPATVTSLSGINLAEITVNAYAIQADEIGNIDDAIKYFGNDGKPTFTAVATADQLKDALAAGGEVKLTSNINVGSTTLTVAKDTTIDLNGCELSGTCGANQAHLIMVKNGAALNVKDSSADDSGKITYAKTSASANGWTIDLEGELNLYAGTIELTGDGWSIGYAVDVRPNAWGTNYAEDTVFHMYGGKIVSSDGGLRVASSSSDSYGNIVASFIMDGGEIDAAYDGVFIQQSNAAYDTLKVEINDGTITSDVYPIRFYGPAPTSVNSGAEKPMTLTVKSAATVQVDGAFDTSKNWYKDGEVAYNDDLSVDLLNQYATISLE